MFSALKGRLQQKGATGASSLQPGSSLSSKANSIAQHVSPKGTNSQSDVKSEDPYTLSVHTALQSRKRERESATVCHSLIDGSLSKLAGSDLKSTEDANQTLTPTEIQGGGQTDEPRQLQQRLRSDSTEKDPTHCLVEPLPTPRLLSEDEIMAQRNLALDTLAMCMHTTSYFWSRSGTSNCDGSDLDMRNLWRLPACVESYLFEVFFGSGLRASPKGKSDTLLEADEFQLLENVREELGAKQRSASSASPNVISATKSGEVDTTVEESGNQVNKDCCLQLAHLIHATWYLISAQWRHAVLGVPSNNKESSSGSSPSAGWCYSVYLHEHHMLPDAIKYTKGHEVALQLETWKGAQRVRRSALELLALLLKDYRSMSIGSKVLRDDNTATQMTSSEMKKSSRKNVSSESSSSHDRTKDGFLIPTEVRRSLEDMIVKNMQSEKNFTVARQVYTDMTLGTANWKVGLFSAGEVHMRRSIERVERNRIVHLLNNERAMQMLHSMRELMNVAEKNLTPSEQTEFFIQSVNIAR